MTDQQDDIVRWLRGMGEFTRRQTTNGYRYDEAAEEIERLKELLSCALSEHDCRHGEFAPGYLPKHWTHEARAALAMSDAELSKALEIEAERDQLRIENGRLRAALDAVAGFGSVNLAGEYEARRPEDAAPAARLLPAHGEDRDLARQQCNYDRDEHTGWE